MSTLQDSPRPWTRLCVTVGAGLLALGTLIAVAVTAVVLAAGSATRTPHHNPATHNHAATGYVPLIQYRGTGAPPGPQAQSPAVANPAPAGYVRDPATHALRRIPTTTTTGPKSIPARRSYGAGQ
jgi:hypothetical protein